MRDRGSIKGIGGKWRGRLRESLGMCFREQRREREEGYTVREGDGVPWVGARDGRERDGEGVLGRECAKGKTDERERNAEDDRVSLWDLSRWKGE